MPATHAPPPQAAWKTRFLAGLYDLGLVIGPAFLVVVAAGFRGREAGRNGDLVSVDFVAMVLPFVALAVAEAVGGATPGATFRDLEVWAPGDRRPSLGQATLRALGRLPGALLLGVVPVADLVSGTRLCERHSPGSPLDGRSARRIHEAFVCIGWMPAALTATAGFAIFGMRYEGAGAAALAAILAAATVAGFWLAFAIYGAASFRGGWRTWRTPWWPVVAGSGALLVALAATAPMAEEQRRLREAMAPVIASPAAAILAEDLVVALAPIDERRYAPCGPAAYRGVGDPILRGRGIVLRSHADRAPFPGALQLSHATFRLPRDVRATSASDLDWIAYEASEIVTLDEQVARRTDALLVVGRHGGVLVRRFACEVYDRAKGGDAGKRTPLDLLVQHLPQRTGR